MPSIIERSLETRQITVHCKHEASGKNNDCSRRVQQEVSCCCLILHWQYAYIAVRHAGECDCVFAGVQESNLSRGEELRCRGSTFRAEKRREKRPIDKRSDACIGTPVIRSIFFQIPLRAIACRYHSLVEISSENTAINTLAAYQSTCSSISEVKSLPNDDCCASSASHISRLKHPNAIHSINH